METVLLNHVTFPTSVVTKAARCVLVAGDANLVDFAFREHRQERRLERGELQVDRRLLEISRSARLICTAQGRLLGLPNSSRLK